MTNDKELLEQYTSNGSESAFGELVSRHIDLVYSVALRILAGDCHLAQDVTQVVFMDLARKARRLPRDVLVAGWLYRHAWYTAAKAVRTERRRQTRERIATEMKELNENNESTWGLTAPHLDKALNELNTSERDAIVLRFLKRQDFATVGAALGISEEAARKRVSRTLEKLRGILSSRGLELTATGLATVLTSEAVTAAPAGLAAGVTVAALTAATGTGTTLTLIKLMATTKLEFGFISAMLVATVAMPLLIQHQVKTRLRAQDEALRQQEDQLAKLQRENADLSKELARSKSASSLPPAQWRELMRRRAEVGRLRKDLEELAKLNPIGTMSRTDKLALLERRYSERIGLLKSFLDANPSERIPEMEFLTDENWVWLAGEETSDTEEGHERAMSLLRLTAEGIFFRSTLQPALQRYAQDNGGQFPKDFSQLKPYFGSSVNDAMLQRWQILPASHLVNLQENLAGEDWVITQKAPVNAGLDQRIVFGLKQSHMFSGAPSNQWDVVP